MSMIRPAIIIAAFSFLAFQMCGCASSNLVDMWHETSLHTPPMQKILVISMRKDAAKRRIWEDAFATALSKLGTSAVSSYSLFPDVLPDTNQILSAVQESSFDGVLVIYRLPTEINTQYIRGYTSTEQEIRYNPYWQRYRSYYSIIEHPGRVDSQTVDIRTIDVSTTGNGGRLVWTATSRTPDPASVEDVQKEIADLVMPELAKQNIISLKK